VSLYYHNISISHRVIVNAVQVKHGVMTVYRRRVFHHGRCGSSYYIIISRYYYYYSIVQFVSTTKNGVLSSCCFSLDFSPGFTKLLYAIPITILTRKSRLMKYIIIPKRPVNKCTAESRFRLQPVVECNTRYTH